MADNVNSKKNNNNKSKNFTPREKTKFEKFKESHSKISYGVGLGLSIGKICVLFLLIVCVYRVLLDSGNISFYGFLNTIKDVPALNVKFLEFAQSLVITADWGIINGLRDFINTTFLPCLQLIWILGSSFWQIIIFIIYILSYVLGISL